MNQLYELIHIGWTLLWMNIFQILMIVLGVYHWGNGGGVLIVAGILLFTWPTQHSPWDGLSYWWQDMKRLMSP